MKRYRNIEIVYEDEDEMTLISDEKQVDSTIN